MPSLILLSFLLIGVDILLLYYFSRANKLLIIIPILFTILIPTLVVNINPFASETKKTPQVALIFGAGILNNSVPSIILKNRLDIGLDLYTQSKVKAIIVSGDNSAANYNEPAVMKNYLISKGVPTNRIFEDFGGVRTADSCYRARNYFNLEEVYLITQEIIDLYAKAE